MLGVLTNGLDHVSIDSFLKIPICGLFLLAVLVINVYSERLRDDRLSLEKPVSAFACFTKFVFPDCGVLLHWSRIVTHTGRDMEAKECSAIHL